MHGCSLPAKPDPHFVVRVVAGDKNALDQIVPRYHERIQSYCYRVIGNVDKAEDATSETLLTIVSQANRLRIASPEAFEKWLFRIAQRKCIDVLRQAKRDPAMAELDGSTEEIEATIPRASETNEAHIAMIRKALNMLCLKFREAIILADFESMTSEEAGAFAGISAESFRQRLMEARAALKVQLTAISE